jgi:hypothetical protein
MAFCSRCGAQLGDGERFCGKCGSDVTAKAAVPVAAPVAAAPIPPPPYAVPMQPPPPPYAAPPYPQGLPGQPPIILGAPPAQPKHNGWIWAVVIVAVLGAGYYYNEQHPQTPTQPGTTPGQQPAPGQPGGQGQGGNNAALVQAQSFTGQVGEANGQVQISNGQWTNNSTVAIQSATLECIQSGSAGTALAQTQTTLTGPSGPLQPQSSTTFNPFQVGAVVQGATKANCGFVGVIPAD